MSNPVALSLQPNAALTRAILLGQAEYMNMPGLTLFPRVDMPFGTQRIRYGHIDPEGKRFEEIETRRGFSQRFVTVNLGITFDELTTVRHGIAAMADYEEQTAAQVQLSPLRWMAQRINTADRMMQRSIEGIRDDVALDPSSFAAGHEIDIPPSEEWNASAGDPRGVIDAAVDLIYAATDAQPDDLALMLSQPAMMALRANPDWRSFRAASGNESRPKLADVAEFLGIGMAWMTSWKRLDVTTKTMVPAFGDSCILYINKTPTDVDVSMGTPFVWGVDPAARAPFASMAVDQPLITSTVWTFTDYSQPTILNPEAAVLINNTHTTVY